MKPIKRSLFLLAVYLASVVVIASPASAQVSVPAVDLSCSSPNPSGAVEIQVYPGAALTGYANCKVKNPNTYVERIQIQVQADGLVVAGGGTITIGANGETDVQVTVGADQRMTMSKRNLKVTATVVEANGVPPPNIAESEYTMIISILQFSRLQVEAVEPFLQLSPKTDHNFEFKVYNQGNWADKFKVGVTEESRDKLEGKGFQISIPLVAVEIEGSGSPPMKVRVMLRTPKNQGWTDEYHTLEFNAESEFSCRYETTGCNAMSQMITIYVRGVYLPGFEIIPSLAMLGFAAAVIARRNIEDDDDEDAEWRESAPGL